MVRHNLAANDARFLKCVRPFWDAMHYRIQMAFNTGFTTLCHISVFSQKVTHINFVYIRHPNALQFLKTLVGPN